MDNYYRKALVADPHCPVNCRWPLRDEWKPQPHSLFSREIMPSYTRLVGQGNIERSALQATGIVSFYCIDKYPSLPLALTGDYETNEWPMEAAEFTVALKRPTNYPEWMPLWDCAFGRIENYLTSSFGPTRPCTEPFLSCPSDDLLLSHPIFDTAHDNDLHLLQWDVPQRYKTEVVDVLDAGNEMIPLPLHDVYSGDLPLVEEYSSVINGALIDASFLISHTSASSLMHIHHNFHARITSLTIIAH
ncbi:hypothetical protein NP233_g984 [Leucocoprinus birnbaumii]|uniref:Uncharacterized protein n=1 Tax=Leucocoprinus birnbaumii TaxID=56174 RepID=A0AAD5W0T8_9AGAR|nr:hypothetical protein NP233_g984 [Leucocoprinus birnbaumii]